MSKYVPTQDNTHLKDLILKWKEDPTGHHPELVTALDKIIMSALRRSGKTGWSRNFETQEDLLPTYRAFCMPLLYRIKPDVSNKEMFSYISNSVYWYNKNRKKASVKKNTYENEQLTGVKHVLLRNEPHTTWDDVVYFEDKDMNSLSELLIKGYSLTEARKTLHWDKEKAEEIVSKIREFYMELGYGTRQ